MTMEEETLPIVIGGFSVIMLISLATVVVAFAKSNTISEKKAMGCFLGFLVLFSISVVTTLTVIGPPGKSSTLTSMRIAVSGIFWSFSMLSFFRRRIINTYNK